MDSCADMMMNILDRDLNTNYLGYLVIISFFLAVQANIGTSKSTKVLSLKLTVSHYAALHRTALHCTALH